MISFIKHLSEAIRFMQLPKAQRRLTFYSEGKNYWSHLEGLIQEILTTSKIPVCYISSGKDDPGLLIKHQNYQTFKIDDGFIRNWLFENIDTDVMVMTMPDLHQYQVKRSKYKVHYIYVQHSLVSLHMIYRKGAFDHYTTIFCAGPHQVREIRAMEERYNLPVKNIVEHGYGRLDSIIEDSKKLPKKVKVDGEPLHVLIAPTWGEKGTLESGLGKKIIDKLILEGFRVTLRPHPQTLKFSRDKVDEILKKYAEEKLFSCEDDVDGKESLYNSDVMVSDWSGVALEYAFGLNKPIYFVNVPRKINNENYEELGIEPFEVFIRKTIGHIMRDNDVLEISNIITTSRNKNVFSKYVFNIGCSSRIGGRFIKNALQYK